MFMYPLMPRIARPSRRTDDGRDVERCGPNGHWREKDHDGAERHTRSMAVGVWLLHDLVVHELLELLLGEAVHQLASLVSCLEVLAVLAYFVDMHLK